ncbi:MAG: hypothetical protein BWX80_03901 [Candidatus Hydrogenedentes bacterium ADurb.Bin101]|nr:MAG: hypothetical protein BWX80_03901 [Candidatus Hydrogenedentes bacterium ADurb.Bin101]
MKHGIGVGIDPEQPGTVKNSRFHGLFFREFTLSEYPFVSVHKSKNASETDFHDVPRLPDSAVTCASSIRLQKGFLVSIGNHFRLGI